MLSGSLGLLRVVVHLESVFVHLHTPVTKASYLRRRCARRRALHKTHRCVFALTPHSAKWLGVYRLDRPRSFPRFGTSVLRYFDISVLRCFGASVLRCFGASVLYSGYEIRIRIFTTCQQIGGRETVPGISWVLSSSAPRRGEADGSHSATEVTGFPGRPVRDARSAEWELMTALSLTLEGARARIPRSHYHLQATVPA